MREIERAEVVRKAHEAGAHLISFFWCDNGGIIRGKSTHISGLESRLDSGISVATAMQAMGDMDQLQVIDGMGPAGEFRLMPDPDTFTILPYTPRRTLMLCDLIARSHEPWEACPRDFLNRNWRDGTSTDYPLRWQTPRENWNEIRFCWTQWGRCSPIPTLP